MLAKQLNADPAFEYPTNLLVKVFDQKGHLVDLRLLPSSMRKDNDWRAEFALPKVGEIRLVVSSDGRRTVSLRLYPGSGRVLQLD